MKRFTSRCVSSQSPFQNLRSVTCRSYAQCRALHTTPIAAATAHPITAQGPPPRAPEPSGYGDRVDQRRRKAEMLKQGKEIRDSQSGKATSALKKRFWKDVHVKDVKDGYQVHLDSRPVRSPDKTIITMPSNKPHLAHALALEWDLLESAQQALKHHMIPLTSLVSRAEDIVQQDARGQTQIRDDIVKTVMRYFDTDTLLCWDEAGGNETSRSFEGHKDVSETDSHGRSPITSLRELQIKVAQPIIGFLTTRIWPGVEIKPCLEPDSILPTPQPQETKDIARGWVYGLPAYEIAALERGVLASKSFLVAVRLLVEWSPNHETSLVEGGKKFGVEEAAEASTLEVLWQTGMWGEVEDSHDVQKEDLKRQLGSVVLLVSGV